MRELKIKKEDYLPLWLFVYKKWIFIIVWILIFATLFIGRHQLKPFILAFALAYVLNPLINWISAKKILLGHERFIKISRGASVIFIYIIFASLLSLATIFVAPKLYKEIQGALNEGIKSAQAIDEEKINNFISITQKYVDEKNLHTYFYIDNKKYDPNVKVPFLQIKKDTNSDNLDWTKYNNGSVEKNLLDEDISRESHYIQDNLSDKNLNSEIINTNNQQAILTLHPFIALHELKNNLGTLFNEQKNNIFVLFKGFIIGFLSIFTQIALILMLSAFILLNPQKIEDGFKMLLPQGYQDEASMLLVKMDDGLSGVVRGQFLICLVNGILTSVGLYFLKIKFALLLGVIAAIFSLIPIFGTVLSTIPIFVIALSSGPKLALFALIWIGVIHFIEANFLNPKIMGDSATLHPILIVFALLVGEAFYGIIGALFAVPCMSLLVTWIRFNIQRFNMGTHYLNKTMKKSFNQSKTLYKKKLLLNTKDKIYIRD